MDGGYGIPGGGGGGGDVVEVGSIISWKMGSPDGDDDTLPMMMWMGAA